MRGGCHHDLKGYRKAKGVTKARDGMKRKGREREGKAARRLHGRLL
jgi:hypothetical protein